MKAQDTSAKRVEGMALYFSVANGVAVLILETCNSPIKTLSVLKHCYNAHYLQNTLF
jgi:hypothetical protein